MNFSDIDIDGAIIHDFAVVPLIKFVITLLKVVKREGESVNQELDLQFNGVRHFKIDLEGEPWVQIVSHGVSNESDYLTTFRSNSDVPADKNVELMHFHIGCGGGSMDIIARSFTFSLTNEVPYIE